MGLSRIASLLCLLAIVTVSCALKPLSKSAPPQPAPIARVLTIGEVRDVSPAKKVEFHPKYKTIAEAGEVKVKPQSATSTHFRGQWPWHTSIICDQTYLVSGALVAPLWVITSAEAVIGHEKYEVVLGQTNQEADEEEGRVWFYGVSSIKIHPDFENETLQNNIAMIKLIIPITATKYIRCIRLPTSSMINSNLTNKVAIVSGYNIQDSDGVSSLGVTLSWAHAIIMANPNCAKELGLTLVTSGTICTSPTKRKSCPGDTGSPLAFKDSGSISYTLVGVLSFDPPNCPNSTLPSVYTRVSAQMPWITELIALGTTTQKPQIG